MDMTMLIPMSSLTGDVSLPEGVGIPTGKGASDGLFAALLASCRDDLLSVGEDVVTDGGLPNQAEPVEPPDPAALQTERHRSDRLLRARIPLVFRGGEEGPNPLSGEPRPSAGDRAEPPVSLDAFPMTVSMGTLAPVSQRVESSPSDGEEKIPVPRGGEDGLGSMERMVITPVPSTAPPMVFLSLVEGEGESPARQSSPEPTPIRGGEAVSLREDREFLLSHPKDGSPGVTGRIVAASLPEVQKAPMTDLHLTPLPLGEESQPSSAIALNHDQSERVVRAPVDHRQPIFSVSREEIPSVGVTLRPASERLIPRDPLVLIEPYSSAGENEMVDLGLRSSQKVAGSEEVEPGGVTVTPETPCLIDQRPSAEGGSARQGEGLDPRSIADQVERRITLPTRHDEPKTVRIQLHPEELGKIQVTLSMENQNLKVEILTEHPAVRTALMDQVDQLRENLLRRNLSIGSFDVFARPDGFSQEMPQQRREPARNRLVFSRWGGQGSTADIPVAPVVVVPARQREYSLVDMRL
ncbi:MAG: hypothetical protein Fur0034_17500 [Desulfuromonadia bacterium]